MDDIHPSEQPLKTQKHTYAYDANGNLLHECIWGNGTGQAKTDTSYTYDALNRLVSAHDNYGNSTRAYTYADTGLYATLTISAGTLYAVDGGFIVEPASPQKPLGAIVWAFGYPYLKPLIKN